MRLTKPSSFATAWATELLPLPAGPSIAIRSPSIDPPSISDSPTASPQGLESLEVVREGLGDASGVANPDARREKARHSEGHRHPVVPISLHHRRPYGSGRNEQQIPALLHRDPEPPQLRRHGGYPIRLLMPGVLDVLYDGRRGSEGRYGSEGHHGVREGVHVYFYSPQPFRPPHLHPILPDLHLATHLAQHVRKAHIPLRRSRTEP